MAEEMTFEKKLEKIEEITKKIQSADSDIEKTVELYEEAMKLVAEADKTLSELERKVEIVTSPADSDSVITEEYSK